MKKKYLLIISLIVFLLNSCDHKEFSDESNSPKGKISLSYDEYKSIAFEDTKSLDDDEVIKIVNDFSSTLENKSTKTNTTKPSVDIQKRYFINFDVNINQVTKSNSHQIPICEVKIRNNEKTGFAIVSGDERFPYVLSYIDDGDINDTIFNKNAALMMQYSIEVAKADISKSMKIRDSLRYKTIDKINKTLNISNDSFSFENVKDFITIEGNPQLKVTTPVGNIVAECPPLLSTRWNQNAPYNNKVGGNCNELGASYQNRYPAGCVAIAVAQIMTKLEPAFSINGANVDWKSLKDNPNITLSDSEYKIEQVSSLIQTIGKGCKTTYDCSGSGAYMSDAVSYMKKYKITTDWSWWMNVDKIKSSLDNLNLVLISGSKSNKGGHAWLLDGYVITNNQTRSLPNVYNLYIHANFGWGNAEVGYFIAGTNNKMTFPTVSGEYDSNFTIYTNVKLKN